MDQPQLLKIKWNKTWQHISEGSNATIIPNTPSFNFFKELFISITNKWLATLRQKRSKQIIKRGCYLHCAYCLLKYFIGESRWIATNNILSCPHCLTRNLFNKDAFPSTAQQRFMTSLPLCTIVTQTNPNPCLFFFSSYHSSGFLFYSPSCNSSDNEKETANPFLLQGSGVYSHTLMLPEAMVQNLCHAPGHCGNLPGTWGVKLICMYI